MASIDRFHGNFGAYVPSNLGKSSNQSGAIVDRMKAIAGRSLFGDLLTAVVQSRVIRAVVLTIGAALVANFIFHLSLPLICAVAGGIFLSMLLFPNPLTAKREVLFELDNFRRLFSEKNYHTIKDTNILLGSMPNRLRNDAEQFEREGVAAVLSVNEDWERSPRASMLPYRDGDYKGYGIDHYKKIEVKDHCALLNEAADEAADFINEQLKRGKVYVHCKAGQGRSAYAVAAYLIKHKKMSANDAVKVVKESRPVTTIDGKKKQEALAQYETHCSLKKTALQGA